MDSLRTPIEDMLLREMMDDDTREIVREDENSYAIDDLLDDAENTDLFGDGDNYLDDDELDDLFD